MIKTILFVDDDAEDREILAEVLKTINPGVNAVFAENGIRAIEYLLESLNHKDLPCLVVLDLNMPFLDGKETYKKIKNELKIESVPVIIFTSSSNPSDKQMFSSLGVEFITKPDDFEYFNKAIRYMVNVCSST
jgi:CheY-like chemotaxis protein